MFHIICLGRMDFLVAVLNGLAMLTSEASPAGFSGMIALGLLIGTLLALGTSIITQRLEIHWVFVGWLMFEVLYVPKVTVTVEDIHTGATNTVANVPLGPAAIGSITSGVGEALADAFGTVFSMPSMTQGGYLDTLTLLNSIRRMELGPANAGGTANAAGASPPDMQKSIRAYLIDCVFFDMAMGLPTSITWAKLRASNDLLTAIDVESGTWYTNLYLNGTAQGQSMTCQDAYAALTDFMRNHFLPAWVLYIQSKLGITDATASLQTAMDTLLGVGHDAQTYMLDTVVQRELNLAELGYHAQANDTAGIVMRVQAMEQRHTQWASEQSMWEEMARPAIAYIEGFFYAVSPFMAFVFVLGRPGITIFGRYLLMAVWIQLWLPILAVSHLFITISASSDLQRIAAGGLDPLSLSGLESVWTTTSSWLAIGGSMVAATPLLSLILITGSYFALTSLTNRLAGGDHVNEKVASPDLVSPAPVASLGANYAQSARFADDPTYGRHAYGAEGVAPSIAVGSTLSSMQQSKSGYTADATSRLMQEAFSGVDLSQRHSLSSFVQNYSGESNRSSATQTDQVMHNLARSVVDNDERFNQMSNREQSALTAAVALGFMAGGSGPQVQSVLNSIQAKEAGERDSWAHRIDQLTRHDSGKAVDLARAVVSDEQHGARSEFLQALGVQDGQRWSEAVNATLTALSSFDEVASLNQSFGTRQDISALAFGHVAEVTGTTGELTRLVQKYNDPAHHLTMGNVKELAGLFLSRGWSTNEKHAYGAAAAVLLGAGTSESALDLARYGAQYLASSNVSLRDPSSQSGLAAQANSSLPAAGEVKGAVDEHVTGSPGVDGAHLRSWVDSELKLGGDAGSQQLRERGDQAVEKFFKARLQNNAQEVERAMADLDRVAAVEKGRSVETAWQDTRSLLRFMQEENLWTAGNPGPTEHITHSLGTATQAMRSAYEEAQKKGGSASDAMRAGLAAGAKGLVSGWEHLRDDKAKDGLEEAHRAGVSEAAAQFYAYERGLVFASPAVQVQHSLGHVESFNQLRRDAVAEIGEIGVQGLERAQTATSSARQHYLEDAATLYKARQAEKQGAPLEPAHQPH